MERLTHERVNGIKTGYWSAATKEALVQKLAAYENTGYLRSDHLPRRRQHADHLHLGRGAHQRRP